MQRIRKSVLDAPGALLPRRGVLDPVSAMGDVCPSADVRDTRHQSIDVAIDAIEMSHLFCDPIGRQSFFRSGQMEEAMGEQPRVAFGHYLAEIRYLTHFPKEPHCAGMPGELGDILVA